MEWNRQLSLSHGEAGGDDRQAEKDLGDCVPAETEDVREVEQCGVSDSWRKIGGQPEPKGNRLCAQDCSIASSMSITGMSLTIG